MNKEYSHYKSLKLETWREQFSEEEVDFDALKIYLDSLQVFINRVDINRYCEKHHVFPLCIDKEKLFTDEKVQINGSDHFRAHILLSKCFVGINRQKLCAASQRMLNNIKRDTDLPTAEEYEEEKRLFVESQRGKDHVLYGKKIYNDGVNNLYFEDNDTPPEYLKKGRISIGHKYNNGEIERCFKDGDEIPAGFIFGAISHGKCYNNGVVEKYFKDTDTIPAGFVKGKITSPTKIPLPILMARQQYI